MKPRIGVTSSHEADKAQLYIRENYLSSLLDAGMLPMVLPETNDPVIISEYLDSLDGILLSGGGDVDPQIYGEERIPACGEPDAERDSFERLLTKEALKRGVPVFGICRGCQLLAVVLGSSLIQDIETQCGIPEGVHRQQPPYDNACHAVHLTQGGMFERITGKRTLQTNSSHHQAVKELGSGLKLEAVSEDGIIEGFSCDGLNAFAVQFHPEHMAYKDKDAAAFFHEFGRMAEEYHNKKVQCSE